MHHPDHVGTDIRALRISALLIGVYFIFEITVAIASGSLSLLADAGHELSTFIAIGVSLVAIRLASRPPTPRRTFGYLRGQVLAALFNGLLLLVMAGFIISQGIDRIQNPMEVPSTPMFIMAIGGIGLEIAALAIMWRGQQGDLNIRGSFWHVVNAMMGSLAVIIAALFIEIGQIYVADAWAGILFSLVLIWAAYGILRDAFRILMDETPPEVDLSAVAVDLKQIGGVVDVHHFHARTITSQVKVFSGHLVVSDLSSGNKILAEAKDLIDDKYGFNLSTIQLEEPGLVEADQESIEASV